jgi:hypothetical protein
MRVRIGIILLTAATAALTVALGTVPALAAGGFTGTGTIKLKDTTSDSFFTCKASISGTYDSSDPAGIGSVTGFGLTCSTPLGPTYTVTAGGLPWPVTTTATSKSEQKGTITGMHMTLSGTSCTAAVDGTDGSADNGTVTFGYRYDTRKLTFGTGGDLHFYDVNGCFGLIDDGDTAVLSGTVKLTPTPASASPERLRADRRR